MKRRNFLLSGSASAALALTGCGGGADEGATARSLASTSGTSAAGGVPALRMLAAGNSGVAYPFGARLVPYVAGIRPSQGNSAMDAVLTRGYDAWKAARLVPVDWIAPGGYAVQFTDHSYLAVSEGMGYGMLIAVLFAGHDPQARTIFDGLLAVVRARSAWAVSLHDPNGKYLMDWRLWSSGASAGAGWNAMDGDLDIAMALLMADKQWGSGGSWNYLQEGKNTIAALKSWNMKPDGTTTGLPDANNNRTSDYMIGHFRAFKAATGDSLWDSAVDRAYAITDRMQTVYSPGVGLMPDFVMGTNGAAYPSTGYIGDGNDKEGDYYWNACRNPWRFASDYLLSGDGRIHQVTGRIIDFFKNTSGGDPLQINTSYTLWGQATGWGQSPAYHGPICAGACIDARFQGFLDAMWNWNASHLTSSYFDGEIQLLSMAVASGNWWSPATFSASGAAQPSAPAPAQLNAAPVAGGAAVAGNILVNGDFSAGMSNWENWGNTWATAGTLQCGNATGGAGQSFGAKLTAGASYQLTGTANVTNAGDSVYLGVKLMDTWGNVLMDKQQAISSVTPAGVSLSFTAPQGVASGLVYIWKNWGSAVGVVDNLSLAAAGSAGSAPLRNAPAGGANLLANGDFSNDLSGWENWGNAWAWGGTLQVGTSAGGVGQSVKLAGGSNYQLTGSANITSADEGVYIGVKLMDTWGNVLADKQQVVSSLTPAGVSISFTAPQGVASGLVYVWKNWSGAVGIVDNLSLAAA